MMERLKKSAAFIEKRFGTSSAKTALVLGSGLGPVADKMKVENAISYSEIPGFLPTSVAGHAGRLLLARFQGGPQLLVLQGRVHYYEGHSLEDVVHSVRTMKLLGIERVLLTNASGGVNSNFRPKDFMLIVDHLNMTGLNPLHGPNLADLGPRFPDMSEAYDKKFASEIRSAAQRVGISLKEGVYCGLQGPTYETPAEVRMLRLLGADAVGMSTVSECIAANHAGLKVAGLACITNLCAGLSSEKLSHQEVVDNGAAAAGDLARILEALFGENP